MKYTLADSLQHLGTIFLIIMNFYLMYNDMEEIIGEVDRNLLLLQFVVYLIIFFTLKINHNISSNMELLIWLGFTVIIFVSDIIKRNKIQQSPNSNHEHKHSNNNNNDNPSSNNSNINLENDYNFNNGYSYDTSSNGIGGLYQGEYSSI